MITGPFKQNEITTLPVLESFRYENLFNVYKNSIDQNFYNILVKTNFPDNIEETYYTDYIVQNNNVPYTLISYKSYGTTLLWWLICSVNKIQNPVFFPKAGTRLKILKPNYVRGIIYQVNNTQ